MRVEASSDSLGPANRIRVSDRDSRYVRFAMSERMPLSEFPNLRAALGVNTMRPTFAICPNSVFRLQKCIFEISQDILFALE